MFSTPCQEDKKPEPGHSLEYMRNRIQGARKELANNIVDLFVVLDRMTEEEFKEVISSLDGQGVIMSLALEKFRKYKAS